LIVRGLNITGGTIDLVSPVRNNADDCAGIMVPVPDRTKEWPEGPALKKERREQLKRSQL
jgi:hypothetical protein